MKHSHAPMLSSLMLATSLVAQAPIHGQLGRRALAADLPDHGGVEAQAAVDCQPKWIPTFGGEPAGQATFQGLGLLPGGYSSAATGVSAEGTFVVGTGTIANGANCGQTGFYWTSTAGLQQLFVPDCVWSGLYAAAFAVGAEGSVIVGTIGCGSATCVGQDAVRWNSTCVGQDAVRWNWRSCYYQPQILAWGPGAFAVSADGSVVVGTAGFGMTHAFRLADDGVTYLASLQDDHASEALGISDNGSTIVGRSSGFLPLSHAVRWTADEGVVDLGFLEGDNTAIAYAASADGSVIVGTSGLSTWSKGLQDARAFRWTSHEGMMSLGSTIRHARALAVSDDGSYVVGGIVQSEISGDAGGGTAWLWHTVLDAMINLNEYLPALGVDLTGWTLVEATGISANGRTIVGHGYHNGVTEAWIARIPPIVSVPGDVNDDGIVNVLDLLAVIAARGPCPASPQPCPEDIAPSPDGDDVVNTQDILMVASRIRTASRLERNEVLGSRTSP